MGIDVIIPVYKPDKKFEKLFVALLGQTLKPDRIILMNTEAEGFMCADIAKRLERLMKRRRVYGKKQIEVRVVPVKKEEFDHGGTRKKAVQLSGADYFVMMTQDAVPADDYLLERLILAVKEEGCALSYARQCAPLHGTVVEQYTRMFNYPNVSCVKTKADLKRLGIKTYFCSDVCAAYKRSAYDMVGGFVERTIFNEDAIIASRFIDAGYSIAYVAEAKVYHSHNYSLAEQFKRNFDLGVSHAQYREIFARVPAEGEGMRLVKNTFFYLVGQKRYLDVLDLVFQSGAKFLGYQLGRRYYVMPKKLLLACSSNAGYFEPKNQICKTDFGKEDEQESETVDRQEFLQ
ncbi:MAG: glycosyltransferase family 2 protein [Lachnospiraceae bacterium]|nr:glycosyltransferase family 2 protein [Lachnospiraceae bacterium]